jgi:4-hydroxyacetophenone monooxygenase
VISAVGQLNTPLLPSIPGLERFQGPAFHSARWRDDVDLTGKRVAVIGTGASAFQFVPEIAPQVAQLDVFQRTPPWLGPTPNYHDNVGPGMQWLLEHMPFYANWYRFWLFWMLTDGVLPGVQVDPEWQGPPTAVSALNAELRGMLEAYIESQLTDRPDLIDKVTPRYPPGGKRMLRDNGVWLAALKRPNVNLITDAIQEVVADGVVTADGVHHRADALIYGTGFAASHFLDGIEVIGRTGQSLHDRWAGDARAYLGMTVPGFPNFFMIYGPNTNIVVNGSIIFFSECSMHYILRCVQAIYSGQHPRLDVRKDVHDAFNAKVDAGNASMAWGAPQVNSWYKNAAGRVSQNWPFALVDYWTATRTPNFADFRS